MIYYRVSKWALHLRNKQPGRCRKVIEAYKAANFAFGSVKTSAKLSPMFYSIAVHHGRFDEVFHDTFVTAKLRTVDVLKYLFPLLALLFTNTAFADDRPIFDAHIHYSHDAVKLVPPEQVVKILKDAGVRKALVSSSDDNGTQLLVAAAPDIVVPALRPYRRRGEISTWMHDETVIDYLEANLATNQYEVIGEFHAYGDDIKTPVIQRMIALAKERNLILHHHGDREAVDQIFETWPEARVLWAHSGFDDPDSVVDALNTHPKLWADLAFRSDMVSRGRVDPDWKAAFEAHPDRFMVGTDTFAPERWYYVGRHADFSREWLDLLPDQIADNIAYANAERLLASK